MLTARLLALSLLTAVLAALAISTARGASTAELRDRAKRVVRYVEQRKTTLRFFENHAFLLYKRATKAEAWFQVTTAREDVARGRAELGRIRKIIRRRTVANLSPIEAIRVVFGPYADQAIRVASCETGGTFSVYAQNGQYLGLFQMGDYARGRYGHSWTALGQARAAYRYFADSGFTWGPWECKP